MENNTTVYFTFRDSVGGQKWVNGSTLNIMDGVVSLKQDNWVCGRREEWHCQFTTLQALTEQGHSEGDIIAKLNALGVTLDSLNGLTVERSAHKKWEVQIYSHDAQGDKVDVKVYLVDPEAKAAHDTEVLKVRRHNLMRLRRIYVAEEIQKIVQAAENDMATAAAAGEWAHQAVSGGGQIIWDVAVTLVMAMLKGNGPLGYGRQAAVLKSCGLPQIPTEATGRAWKQNRFLNAARAALFTSTLVKERYVVLEKEQAPSVEVAVASEVPLRATFSEHMIEVIRGETQDEA